MRMSIDMQSLKKAYKQAPQYHKKITEQKAEQ
jgi:hypothetical protein